MTKPFAGAADQNKAPILTVLQTELLDGQTVLELGSGTGQHACYFAAEMPDLIWYPTELGNQLAGISAWIADSGCENIRPPRELDVSTYPWPDLEADVCYSCNTFHIISLEAVRSTFRGCASVLAGGGKLIVYGPFSEKGVHQGEGNARFDNMLSASDPKSGIRDLIELDGFATEFGFMSARQYSMPVNNQVLVWDKV